MADIICAECSATVSDESEHCTECGYPFENAQSDQDNRVSDVESNGDIPSNTVVTTPLDILLRSMDSVALEIKGLEGRLDGIRQELSSLSMLSMDTTQKNMAEISAKIDTVVSLQNALKAATPADNPKKTKKELLAAFYKTLNSPNSMFEYMFYICVVQIIFIVVILFLAAYIVTLVRE
jgi:hypothetical protein